MGRAKMKKVLLINTNTEKAPYPVPPLGLCLIARCIEKSFDVELFDAVTQKKEELLEKLVTMNPDYIGISIRNIDNVVMGRQVFYLPDIIKNYIKLVQSNTNATLILGGSGFSLFAEEILSATGVKYGIVGEGESAFPELLDSLENNSEPDGISGVVFKKNNHYRVNPPVFSLKMTEVPFSRMYDLVRLDVYRERGSYPLQTKRGCIYSCIYCSYPNLEGRTYRLRNPEEIVDEIQDAQEKLGDILFEFVDSTFNSPSGHAESICEEIINRKLKVRLRTMGINPRETSASLFALMKQAGFAQIDCTPDTASRAMLKTMKKNFSLEQLQSCADLIRKHDMPTMWFFMFGGPGENIETVMETFSFIDQFVSEKDMAFIGEGIRIIPQTELYHVAVRQGLIKENESLLEPVYYVSPDIDKDKLSELLHKEISKRHNIVHALDSVPAPEMLAEAISLRNSQKLTEPMFRTLLRLKRKYSGQY
jgi:radical SAM superfamily enzyme YgiQ (UPF0313 family)